MKFKIERDGIRIESESEQDVAYIEDTLGLIHNHDAIPLVRHNAAGFSSLAFLLAESAPSAAENPLDRELARALELCPDRTTDIASALKACLDELAHRRTIHPKVTVMDAAEARGRSMMAQSEAAAHMRIVEERNTLAKALDAILQSTCIDDHRYCPPFDVARDALGLEPSRVEGSHAWVGKHAGDISAEARGVRRDPSAWSATLRPDGLVAFHATPGERVTVLRQPEGDPPAGVETSARRGLGGYRKMPRPEDMNGAPEAMLADSYVGSDIGRVPAPSVAELRTELANTDPTKPDDEEIPF